MGAIQQCLEPRGEKTKLKKQLSSPSAPKAKRMRKTINETKDEAKKVEGKVKKNKQIDKGEYPLLEKKKLREKRVLNFFKEY